MEKLYEKLIEILHENPSHLEQWIATACRQLLIRRLATLCFGTCAKLGSSSS